MEQQTPPENNNIIELNEENDDQNFFPKTQIIQKIMNPKKKVKKLKYLKKGKGQNLLQKQMQIPQKRKKKMKIIHKI